MNYLAHLYLAGEDDEALVGNLIGDFLKGEKLHQFTEPVRTAIRHHLRIDAFTDAHPLHLQSRRRILPPMRRYAGILVDVYYDHFLARNWSDYSSIPLREFADRCYQALRKHEAILPERLRLAAPRMIEHDWLCSYGEIEGIATTLRRLSRRLKRENPLAGGVAELVRSYPELEADFRLFFPELVTFSRGSLQY
jgi:acyl carrier protein phosphodiesterase